MRSLLLTVSLGLALGSALQAGPLFGWRKAEKPDPKVRVPELLQTLKSDKDEFKRSAALVELRQYDAAVFPDMVPAVIAALFTDTRAGVRIDAAQTLSRFRPVSQTVGEALEQAMEKDVSMRVRLQARSALLSYQWAGYRGGKKAETPAVAAVPAPVTSPTLAPVPAPVPVATEKRSGLGGFFLPSVRTTPAPAARSGGTGEPPLAPAREDKGPLLPPPSGTAPRPLTPPAPPAPPAGPVEGPILP